MDWQRYQSYWALRLSFAGTDDDMITVVGKPMNGENKVFTPFKVPFSTEETVAHPFNKFKSAPSATVHSGLSTVYGSNPEEPKDSPSEIDAESGRSEIGHGHYILPSIQTTLQSAPSSSGVLGQSNGQSDSTVTGPVSGSVTKQFHVTNYSAVRRSISTLRRASRADPPPPTYAP